MSKTTTTNTATNAYLGAVLALKANATKAAQDAHNNLTAAKEARTGVKEALTTCKATNAELMRVNLYADLYAMRKAAITPCAFFPATKDACNLGNLGRYTMFSDAILRSLHRDIDKIIGNTDNADTMQAIVTERSEMDAAHNVITSIIATIDNAGLLEYIRKEFLPLIVNDKAEINYKPIKDKINAFFAENLSMLSDKKLVINNADAKIFVTGLVQSKQGNGKNEVKTGDMPDFLTRLQKLVCARKSKTAASIANATKKIQIIEQESKPTTTQATTQAA